MTFTVTSYVYSFIRFLKMITDIVSMSSIDLTDSVSISSTSSSDEKIGNVTEETSV